MAGFSNSDDAQLEAELLLALTVQTKGKYVLAEGKRESLFQKPLKNPQ